MKRLCAQLSLALIQLSILAIPVPSSGQTTEQNQTPADSRPSDSPGAPPQAPAPATQPTAAVGRPVSWKLLLPNLISDQQHIWTFPARLGQGQNWLPTAAVLATTAGLVALDP